MRRILFIAYAFPPCGGAGVQRTAKFVRYLPEYGWLPTVLTVAASSYGILDASQGSDIPPAIDVIRTPHLDPVAAFTRPRAQAAGGPPPSAVKTPARASTASKILRSALLATWFAVENNLLIPDTAVLWYPRAVEAGLSLLRRQRFDLILATGEPYSAYLIAKALSRRSGVPYVLDMRDPWTIAPYREVRRAAWRQSVERWQERRILAGCRACVFAFRPDGLYDEAYPQWAGKFHYVPNGYDPADFAGVVPRHFDRFTIVHSGTFLPGYRPARPFLVALRGLLSRRPDLAERLQVLFVGRPGEEGSHIQELGLSGVVRQVGYLPHRESISHLLGADLLLLVGGHHRWEETGKVYEYLAAGKPILALVHPQGSAARLLASYPLARVVDRDDLDGSANALETALAGRAPAPSDTNGEWAAPFQRPTLTAKLARILDHCCAPRPTRSPSTISVGSHP
jgi:glycosyltransferase involved in cell wall biosynthesis